MTAPALVLTADQRRLIAAILRAELPRDALVYVFGSRATGRAGRFSDLDLAIDVGRKLSVDEHARLAEAFEDSDLPFRVDLLDWASASAAFRATIAADRVALTPEAAAPVVPRG